MKGISPVCAAAAAPAVHCSAKFIAIEKEADALEVQLEQARASLPSNIHPSFKVAYEAVRTLRRKLAKLDAKSRAQFYKDNPAWVSYWRLA